MLRLIDILLEETKWILRLSVVTVSAVADHLVGA